MGHINSCEFLSVLVDVWMFLVRRLEKTRFLPTGDDPVLAELKRHNDLLAEILAKMDNRIAGLESKVTRRE